MFWILLAPEPNQATNQPRLRCQFCSSVQEVLATCDLNRGPRNRDWRSRVSNTSATEFIVDKTFFLSNEQSQRQIIQLFLTFTLEYAKRAYLDSEQSRSTSYCYISLTWRCYQVGACFCWPVWLGRSAMPQQSFLLGWFCLSNQTEQQKCCPVAGSDPKLSQLEL